MPYPPDMLEPDDATPTESIEFRRELARLLNRYNIDNWAEIPDTILADMLADLVVPIRWGRIATAKWMGQPLLGDKLSATAQVAPRVADHHTYVPGADGQCWVCGTKSTHEVHQP